MDGISAEKGSWLLPHLVDPSQVQGELLKVDVLIRETSLLVDDIGARRL
jgi:hypothetical protein